MKCSCSSIRESLFVFFPGNMDTDPYEGQPKHMTEEFEDEGELIRQYKKSEYVPDAYLALGEHYFADNKLNKATKAYKKAYKIGKKRDRPDTFVYARYKLAWCDYNAQEYTAALKKFKYVVSQAEKGKGKVLHRSIAVRLL